MSLSREQVKHIAKLARLKLNEDEVDRFSTQISSVLDYIEMLNELDTSSIEETHQVTGLKNISRLDEIERYNDTKELLDCSDLPKEDNQIKVKRVV